MKKHNLFRFLQRFRIGEEGQSIAQAAIAFPLVLVVYMFIINISLLYNVKTMTNYAAFLAARAAMVGKNEDDAHVAAAIALSPVCRTVSGELRALDDMAGRFKRVTKTKVDYMSPFRDALDKAEGIAGTLELGFLKSVSKFAVAYYRTKVKISEDGNYVVAEVTHGACLELPVMRRLFPLISNDYTHWSDFLPPDLRPVAWLIQDLSDFYLPVKSTCRLLKGDTGI